MLISPPPPAATATANSACTLPSQPRTHRHPNLNQTPTLAAARCPPFAPQVTQQPLVLVEDVDEIIGELERSANGARMR